jgi:hypothetical protein
MLVAQLLHMLQYALLLCQPSPHGYLKLLPRCCWVLLHVSANCSQLCALTELHLAYKYKLGSPPPNMAAESAAWPGLPLRHLSLADVALPEAALQRLAELPSVTSLELDKCSFENSPRQVAKVLEGERRVWIGQQV